MAAEMNVGGKHVLSARADWLITACQSNFSDTLIMDGTDSEL